MRLRLSLLSLFLASYLSPGCKSRYGFTGGDKSGASENATPSDPNKSKVDPPKQVQGSTPVDDKGFTPTDPATPVDSSTGGATGGSTSSSDTGGGGDPQTPAFPGGPVVGLEVVQNGVVVTSIKTGIPATLRPTNWTKDTDNPPGCDNPGILQALWTIGSRTPINVVRASTNDCKTLAIGGTFTKTGSVVIQLDILTDEGEGANATSTYDIVSDGTTGGTSSATTGSATGTTTGSTTGTTTSKTTTPVQSPTQTPGK